MGRGCSPEGGGAPLTVRNTVRVYDTHLREGQATEAVRVDGLSPWLYVVDGLTEFGVERIGKGDAASDLDQPLPTIRALKDASLVLFLVDRTAQASTAGTISGH